MEARLGDQVFSREEIFCRVDETAQSLNREYEKKRPLFISILRGAVYFTVDLTRKISVPFDIDFMSLSSFKLGTTRAMIQKDLEEPVMDRDVVILEDIVDTGLTLNYLLKVIRERRPASIRVCTFLDCPERRIADIEVDYFCFRIPDVFVVGYGLDFRGNFRNLLEVYTLFDPSGRNTQILKQMGKGEKR